MKTPLLRLSALCLLLFSLSYSFAQNPWSPSELTGFGNQYNKSIRAMHNFNGKLYAGVAEDSGKVYRTPSGTPGSWTQCFYDTNLISIHHFASTTDGGGFLFAAAFAPFGTIGSIYKTADGSNWSLFHTSAGSVNFVETYKGLGSVDSVYSFEYASFGDQIRRAAYNSNDPLDTLSTWDTIFDMSMVSPYARITSTGHYNGKLIFGTSDGTLWSYDGLSFIQNINVGTGFGNPNNNEICAIDTMGSFLYVATRNYSDGTQIWRSDDEISWTLVAQFNGFEKITDFISAGGALWANMISTSSFGPGQIVNSTDGATFTVHSESDFGDPANNGEYGCFAVLGNNLYYGTENYDGGGAIAPSETPGRGAGSSTGGQIWRTCLTTPPTISIGADLMVCSGNPATFNADPGFVSYLWEDGSTMQSLTTYLDGIHYVMATDAGGCVATDSADLSVTPSPDVTITTPSTGTATVCAGDSITIAGTALSNVRLIQPPFPKVTNAFISNSISAALDTITVTGISECSCTSLYSVTIDSLYHDYNIDVAIGLYSPSGYFINLVNNPNGADFIGTEFIMSADHMVTDNGNFAPYTGQYRPQDEFSDLTGSSNGNWVIHITDNYSSDDGYLKGWTLKFSVADSILTYSWNPTTGVTTSMSLNTAITPPSTGAYILTTTNSVGCSVNDTVNLFVPAINVSATNDSLCFGMSTTLNSDATATTYWMPSGSLSSASGISVTATPGVTTMYYGSDFLFGCNATDSVLIEVNPLFTADAGFDQTICNGDSATLSSSATGGTWPYIFTFNDGTTSFAGPSELVGPTINTAYSLLVEDSFGCFAMDTTNVLVAPNTDIYGHVSYSGGAVASSDVILYKYYPYTVHFDTVQITTTDAAGNYHFASVGHENYLIEVFPSASYPTLIPTYYGNEFLWDSAYVISHYCAVDDTLDVTMVEDNILATGPGYLHGRIVQDTGYVRAPGDPIPGVDVKLGRNPGGQMVTSGQTDSNGEYEFTNVAFGNYTVYADIPGLGRDSSYTFTVDSANSIYNYLNYVVDSNTVHYVPDAGVGITETAKTESGKFIVYPNPSKGNATIEYTIGISSDVSLGIYNMLGVKIVELVNTHQQPGTYKLNMNNRDSHLTAGVYFVTLIANGKTNIHKIIITE
jgi:subtilisin-like proprotein convertase family protein